MMIRNCDTFYMVCQVSFGEFQRNLVKTSVVNIYLALLVGL